jgi:flagellar motor switch protein FliN
MATLDKVSVDITVVLGTTKMPIHPLLRLGRGAIELDASEDDPASVLANGLPVAKGTGSSTATASRSRSGNCCRAPPTGAKRLCDTAFPAGFSPAAGLVPAGPICYSSAVFAGQKCPPPHAAVAELVDALA